MQDNPSSVEEDIAEGGAGQAPHSRSANDDQNEAFEINLGQAQEDADNQPAIKKYAHTYSELISENIGLIQRIYELETDLRRRDNRLSSICRWSTAILVLIGVLFLQVAIINTKQQDSQDCIIVPPENKNIIPISFNHFTQQSQQCQICDILQCQSELQKQKIKYEKKYEQDLMKFLNQKNIKKEYVEAIYAQVVLKYPKDDIKKFSFELDNTYPLTGQNWFILNSNTGYKNASDDLNNCMNQRRYKTDNNVTCEELQILEEQANNSNYSNQTDQNLSVGDFGGMDNLHSGYEIYGPPSPKCYQPQMAIAILYKIITASESKYRTIIIDSNNQTAYNEIKKLGLTTNNSNDLKKQIESYLQERWRFDKKK